jgi:hypothetical protein
MFSRMLLQAGPGGTVETTIDWPLLAPFFADQLYNSHAGEFFWLYNRVIAPDYKVWSSGVLHSGKVGSCTAAHFLAHHRWWVKTRRLASNVYSAYHQIDVVTPVVGRHEYTDTLQARNRVFKFIRAKVCKNWLEYVRLLMMAETNYWCDDVVANTVLQQLEAWFATVPHKDVRWSNYLNERDKYRVCWWKD